MKPTRTYLSFILAMLLAGCGSPLKVAGDAHDDGVDAQSDVVEDAVPDGTDDTVDDPIPDAPEDPVPDGSEDLDTDGDTILDVDEGRWDPDGPTDTDGDGTPDFEDTDSDGDTILDADEAGDTDLSTAPDDCDDDGLPNFRDLDSDGDGLTDEREDEIGTDPCDEDSDGDGYTDLMEEAYGSDPLDDTDSPGTYGDFVFLVPYNDAPDPTLDTLVFSTNLKVADVYFLLDQTGSMAAVIDALRTSLTTTVIPGIRAEIADAWFGLAAFQDCGGGGGCPNKMAMLQAMTGTTSDVVSALGTMTSYCGGREPYPQILYASASGDVAAYSSWTGVHPTSWTCTPPGSIGWPCFRPEAVPIFIQIGDEQWDNAIDMCTPAGSHSQAIDAINAIEGKYIGVNTGADPTWSSYDDMVIVATGTGSVDSTTGDPLVFDISSDVTTLGTQVVDAVSSVATAVAIRVDAIAHDDPSDMTDAVATFIDRIETNTSGASIWDPIMEEMRTCTSGLSVGTPGTDPTVDYFTLVDPGVSVCFDIIPERNTTIPASTIPLLFAATIEVIGDEHTPLDERTIYFIIPPEIPGG
ncbi:MAG: hypothetical protein JRG91_20930 [Deltaproteobacteria bacterium]|nr:hypothetical protein [Deltaproteobacteria bacterium]